MKLFSKSEQIAHLKTGNGSIAIQEMLTGYCSTPPYKAIMNRQVRTKLEHHMRDSSENARDTPINERD